METRAANRLAGYDYSTCGVYFLTVCTKDRLPLLCRILDDGTPELTESGAAVDTSIRYLHEHMDGISVEHYVIMPNHLHLLVTVDGGASGRPRPTGNERQNALIPKFVSYMKRYTNRVCGCQLWQSSYSDHIIRDEKDFLIRWHYIDINPARWADDPYHPSIPRRRARHP